jgi:hypothetical protein
MGKIMRALLAAVGLAVLAVAPCAAQDTQTSPFAAQVIDQEAMACLSAKVSLMDAQVKIQQLTAELKKAQDELAAAKGAAKP